ncbi:MAG: hypothetical protein LC118_06510, partial [Dehalococcoidia bacterium]|nr:hypothetical protein [Dehalococcoidia bacterium]
METAVTNPEGALGGPVVYGQTRYLFPTAGAIAKNTQVSITDTGVVAGTASLPVLGVAMTSTTSAGGVVEVVTQGYAEIISSGTATKGTAALAKASGKAETGTATTSLTV